MRYLALGLGAALFFGAIAGWFFLPPTHEAFAVLKLSNRPQTVLNKGEARPEDGFEEFRTFKRTQVQLILTGPVLQRTVSEPGINLLPIIKAHRDDPATWLKKNLRIEYPDDAEVMRIALTTPDEAEAKQIVNMVVDKYLKEIVQHERDLRNDHERKLNQAYEHYSAEVKMQTDTLHKLEVLHKTSSTEAAQVRRNVELSRLGDYMAQRAKLADRITETSLHIMLLEARDEMAQAPAVAEPTPAADGLATSNLSLPLLRKQQEFFEAQLKQADEAVQDQTEVLSKLEDFNVNVNAKLEELKAARAITNDLRAEVDRIKVERLAPERIVKIDDAVWTESEETPVGRYVGLATTGVLGLGLIAVGAVRRRRKT